jgi:hypothetical protein
MVLQWYHDASLKRKRVYLFILCLLLTCVFGALLVIGGTTKFLYHCSFQCKVARQIDIFFGCSGRYGFVYEFGTCSNFADDITELKTYWSCEPLEPGDIVERYSNQTPVDSGCPYITRENISFSNFTDKSTSIGFVVWFILFSMATFTSFMGGVMLIFTRNGVENCERSLHTHARNEMDVEDGKQLSSKKEKRTNTTMQEDEPVATRSSDFQSDLQQDKNNDRDDDDDDDDQRSFAIRISKGVAHQNTSVSLEKRALTML